MVKFIIICATGRSGSTTLQRILNMIPDSNICGENDGAIINILKFYKNIKKTVTMRPGKKRGFTFEKCEKKNIKPCWYNSFNNDNIIIKIKELILELFDNKKNNRVLGCKEIRFIHDDLSLLNDFIELFPETKIILHYKKDIESQSKSDWLALERPKYLCREKKNENIKVEKPKKEKINKIVQDLEKSSKDLKVRQKKANKSVKVVALIKS